MFDKDFILNPHFILWLLGAAVLSTAVTVIGYCAYLGAPVLADKLTAKWLGANNIAEIRMVMQFNEDQSPMDMTMPPSKPDNKAN